MKANLKANLKANPRAIKELKATESKTKEMLFYIIGKKKKKLLFCNINI